MRHDPFENPFSSNKSSFGPTLFGKMFLLMIVLNFALLWCIGSAAASGMKAFINDCDKTYVIEPWVSTDWFCPEKK